MAKDKKAVAPAVEAEEVVVAEEVVEETADEVVEEVAKEDVLGDSIVVTWRGGTRTYSKAVHGKEFRALAKEFATKFDGKLS